MSERQALEPCPCVQRRCASDEGFSFFGSLTRSASAPCHGDAEGSSCHHRAPFFSLPWLSLQRLTLSTSPSAAGHGSPPRLLAGSRDPPPWHLMCLYAGHGRLYRRDRGMPIRAPHAWAAWMSLPRGHPVCAGGGGAAPSQLPGRGHHDGNGRSRQIRQSEEHPSDGIRIKLKRPPME
jgi:hypothetical protein